MMGRRQQRSPVQRVAVLVVQAGPTPSAARVVRHVVTAVVQEWHPSVTGDQSDMACRTGGQVNGQPGY